MLPLSIRIRTSLERTVLNTTFRVPSLVRRLARRRSTEIDGNVLDPDLAAVLRLDDILSSSDTINLGPVRMRLRLKGQVKIVEASPPDGVTTRRLSIPGPAGALPARLYVPDGLDAPSAAILFFHGGGFVTCDLDTHDTFCRRLALGAAARLVAVDYRLAPEHPYPAAKDDALAAFRWLAREAGTLGIDPGRIAVAGDSAGGNLSAVISQATRGEDARPCLQVLVYPALLARREHPSQRKFEKGYFLTGKMIEWYYDQYAPDHATRLEPGVSPLLAEDLHDLPPALVYSAGFDPLRDEAHAYADRLAAAGVRVETVCFGSLAHGFTLMTGAVLAARDATERIAREAGAALRAS